MAQRCCSKLQEFGPKLCVSKQSFDLTNRFDFFFLVKYRLRPTMVSEMVAKFYNLHIHMQQLIDIFIFNILYLNSTIRIFFQLQPKLFSFNKNICSTSTKDNYIQRQYICSTSTQIIFIQQK